jgi:hypothetical protein
MLKDSDVVVKQLAIKGLFKLGVKAAPLYSEALSDEFLKRKVSIKLQQKTGTQTALLGGSLFGKATIRFVGGKSLGKWLKLLRSKEIWKQNGFDYIPIEPIVMKKGKYRMRVVRGGRFGEFSKGTFMVFTKVINGLPLNLFAEYATYDAARSNLGVSEPSNMINKAEFDKAYSMALRIHQVCLKLNVFHKHAHPGNFVVEKKDGQIRVFLIDLDNMVNLTDHRRELERLSYYDEGV